MKVVFVKCLKAVLPEDYFINVFSHLCLVIKNNVLTDLFNL